MAKNITTREAIKARNRERRIRAMIRRGLTQEQIDEYFKNEKSRIVLCILYGNFTVTDGTKKKTIKKRDEHHRVISTEEVELPNVLHGIFAARKFAENEKMTVVGYTNSSIMIKTDEDNVDGVTEKLSSVGRISITKPQLKAEKPKKEKKPTGNTAEAKADAKKKRKEAAKNHTTDKQKNDLKNMAPYYAALRAMRKGRGISERIKKHNPQLAADIEAWLKKKQETLRKALSFKNNSIKNSEEYRAKHRQLTSKEMKARKKSRKAIGARIVSDRRIKRETELALKNKAEREKRAQNASKRAVQAKIEPKSEMKKAA